MSNSIFMINFARNKINHHPKNMGLSLFLSRQIVQANGGIPVSTRGTGAVFSLTISKTADLVCNRIF
jgi:signal transduction histidine kinase